MFNSKPRHINLHLPQSWNQCTTEELEYIAAAILTVQQSVNRYHPFDWERVKLLSVLAINGIEIVSPPAPAVKDNSYDDIYLVRRAEDKEPWPITVGQLHALCEALSWIDDPKADKTVFMFPYPEIHQPSTINHEPLTLVGPPPLLDGYIWQEYRWLTDWMQEYMRCENARRDTTTARNEFLAVLFKKSGGCDKDKVDAAAFAGFDPVRWQVILFWWSSLMAILAKKFPKVFKQQPVGKQRRQQKDTPWDFYNRVIATIQKYVGGLSEKDVNTASYGTILQQLDMMAREAEEMEKLNKKYKHK